VLASFGTLSKVFAWQRGSFFVRFLQFSSFGQLHCRLKFVKEIKLLPNPSKIQTIATSGAHTLFMCFWHPFCITFSNLFLNRGILGFVQQYNTLARFRFPAASPFGIEFHHHFILFLATPLARQFCLCIPILCQKIDLGIPFKHQWRALGASSRASGLQVVP
jgi:hypothetical protein